MTLKMFQEKILTLKPVDLFEYKDQFEEFKLLEKTNQSPTWHAEGNVLIHTNMVMEKALPLAKSMENPNDGVSIYLGALLHDFGKPETTFTKDNGKVVAYGHEQSGMVRAREFLRNHFPDFNYARREWILSLVEYHGHPKRLVKMDSDDLRLKRLSLEVNTEQVYNVEVADYSGRIGPSADSNMPFLETFKQKCKDLDIWDKYYKIPMTEGLPQLFYNLVRWHVLFHHVAETDIRRFNKLADKFNKKRFELMILLGAPGSGKTTYYEKVFPHIQKVSMDDERARLGDINDMSKNQEVFNNCYRMLNNILRNRGNVVWDATNVSRKARKSLINLARQNGGCVSIVHFDLPIEEVLKRNSQRERIVPEEVVKKYYNTLQSPKPYEYDRLLVVEKDTHILRK